MTYLWAFTAFLKLLVLHELFSVHLSSFNVYITNEPIFMIIPMNQVFTQYIHWSIWPKCLPCARHLLILPVSIIPTVRVNKWELRNVVTSTHSQSWGDEPELSSVRWQLHSLPFPHGSAKKNLGWPTHSQVTFRLCSSSGPPWLGAR